MKTKKTEVGDVLRISDLGELPADLKDTKQRLVFVFLGCEDQEGDVDPERVLKDLGWTPPPKDEEM